jgi:hypothetical protein
MSKEVKSQRVSGRQQDRRASASWQLKALCTVSGLALSMAWGSVALAQEAGVEPADAEVFELDEVIVTGIRASDRKSVV